MYRKTLALGIVALVPLVVALAASDVDARGHGRATPAGTWLVQNDFDFIVDPGPPPVTFPFKLANLSQMHADGRVTILLPFGEGHPNESDTRVGCMGEWRPRKGHGRAYDVTMRCLYNQDEGNIYGEIRGILKMKGKDHTEMKFSYVNHHADGSIQYFQGWGIGRGTRIKVDPLP